MMHISLVRHGRSTYIENNRINGLAFKQWTQQYNSCGVFAETSYPADTIERINVTNIVMTSDLERSIESAKWLNPISSIESDPLFREAELPIIKTKKITLSPGNWGLVLRCLWFLGYSKGCESLREAKLRAEKASKLLEEYAKKHTSVVLVGHGFLIS